MAAEGLLSVGWRELWRSLVIVLEGDLRVGELLYFIFRSTCVCTSLCREWPSVKHYSRLDGEEVVPFGECLYCFP